MDQQPTNSQPAGTGLPAQASESFSGNSAAEGELQFYNVMPQTKRQGAVVDPTVKITQTAEAPAGNRAAFLKKYKKPALLVLVILVAAGGIYFAVDKFFLNSYQPENLLAVQPPPKNQNATSTGQQAVSGLGPVTTPPDWQLKYFGSATCNSTACTDAADPDLDGLTNLEEYKLGTDPNNPDSDHDGLADGDEVHVFSSDPLSANTAKDAQYSDTDYMLGGYSLITHNKLSSDELAQIIRAMKQYGLHMPTVQTLQDVLIPLYGFAPVAPGLNAASSTPPGSNASSTSPAATSSPQSASSTPSLPANVDQSPQAKQDRDAQRSNTIENISTALISYKNDHQSFPTTSNFDDLISAIKPYLKVATNATDPINQGVYVYTYTPNQDGSDFTLSFYSETQNQLIKVNSADAAKAAAAETAEFNDEQRKDNLDNIRTALLLYSNKNAGGNQQYVFPPVDKYKTELVPEFIGQIPKDPKTGADYDYEVSATFDSFTLKAVLEDPPAGTTGYLCNEEECRNY